MQKMFILNCIKIRPRQNCIYDRYLMNASLRTNQYIQQRADCTVDNKILNVEPRHILAEMHSALIRYVHRGCDIHCAPHHAAEHTPNATRLPQRHRGAGEGGEVLAVQVPLEEKQQYSYESVLHHI